MENYVEGANVIPIMWPMDQGKVLLGPVIVEFGSNGSLSLSESLPPGGSVRSQR